MINAIAHKRESILSVLTLAVFIAAMCASFVAPAPVGPTLYSNTTESPTPKSALMLNTSGGTVTTLVLNGSTQNLGWKAYVGNITGKLVLQDAQNYSVFEWDISTTSGEIYATRRSTLVDWSNIVCANATHVAAEESAMNQNSDDDDSISNTFVNTTHSEFYVGSKHFAANECNFTTATYVGNQKQYTYFQEVLLYDGSYLVYASLLENATQGFDNGKYDFQMILAEDDTTSTTTAYYFYVELG